MSAVPQVYAAIAAVQAEIGKTGIAKDRKNQQQGYAFRGIDDVYDALAPILAKHGLVVIPRHLSRLQTERESTKGGVIFSVVVESEFDFVAATDGSKHTAKAFGEAMDSADKATNKAMSAAYKYAAFQTFCIPINGDTDADATTHEVKAKVPDGFDNWLADLEVVADEGTAALEAAWKKSPLSLRKFLSETDRAKWETIKARAAKKVPA